jgi:putative MATE family efflux protein
MTAESMLTDLPPPAAPPPRGRIAGLWAELRLAVAGTHTDFTSGSIGRAIFLLAVPMVLEMLMESLFGICDIFFVSRLGAEAVATVGFTESLLTLVVFATAVGLSMATTAMVARRIGEKDRDGAAVAAVQAIIIGTVFALLLGIPGALGAKHLLSMMGGSEQVVAGGATYTAVMMGGSITIYLLFLINAVFRGAGDAAIAMRVLWVANGINLILDPCLIFGLGPFPEMGLTGAAVATTIGRGVGVLLQLWALFRGSRRFAVTLDKLRLAPAVMTRLIRVSLGGIVQFAIATSSWVGLVRIIALFGDAAVAGYTVALKLIVFAILPSWGMSNAAASLVGQNLGAGQPERAETSVWRTGFYNMLFLLAVAVVFITFAPALIGIFTSDPDVLAYGVDCLRWVSYGYGFYAWGMVVSQSFNGAGDTWTPTWINLFCHWLFEIPFAYLLATRFDFGARGVFIGIMVSEAMLALVSIVLFRRGRWKTREI